MFFLNHICVKDTRPYFTHMCLSKKMYQCKIKFLMVKFNYLYTSIFHTLWYIIMFVLDHICVKYGRVNFTLSFSVYFQDNIIIVGMCWKPHMCERYASIFHTYVAFKENIPIYYLCINIHLSKIIIYYHVFFKPHMCERYASIFHTYVSFKENVPM